jgi:gamma-glutamyltranspeptidase/glutathione hydrolase
MKKKIKNLFSLILLFLFFILKSFPILANQMDNYIEPEEKSIFNYSQSKKKSSKTQIIVTANDYASEIGGEILGKGGNAADATVAIQLTLGLVEPQSSGIGGGTFITYYDNTKKRVLFYDGREKAPLNIRQNIFLNNDGSRKKFFDAAIGGQSVGVPGTLAAIFKFHSDYGILKWEDVIEPVINLTDKGFYPPSRLLNALKKDKFLFNINKNHLFKEVIGNPRKKIFNYEYSKTLRKISENYRVFYEGSIAKKIADKVSDYEKNNSLSDNDLRSYFAKKKNALCILIPNKIKICGPNLPSSGTICIAQVLKIIDYIKKNKEIELSDILNTLDFVYYLREKFLADDKFVRVDVDELTNIDFLIEGFFKYKTKKKSVLVEEILNSTSHFSVVDKFENVVSVTSSIESTFGSRLFVNGFFLNNQLTDFSFKSTDKNNELIKNRVQGGKKPLSSMSPLIIFDQNNNFLMSIGSPGGKAIISYVSRVLIDYFYFNKTLENSIKSPNFIKINGSIFLENISLKPKVKENSKVRNLTSGIGIIVKKKNKFFGFADHRRDGTVR